LLGPGEQQAIVDRLAAEPRSAIISSQPLIDFLDQQMHMAITGPLNDYIRRSYRPLFTVSGYEFLVPVASPATPFYVAENFQRAPGATGSEQAMITVNVAATARSPASCSAMCASPRGSWVNGRRTTAA